MKKITVAMIITLGLAAGANAKSCIEAVEKSEVGGLTIQPVSVQEVTTTYADASVDEDMVVTSFVTTFKGSPSKVESKCDEDVIGIDY